MHNQPDIHDPLSITIYAAPNPPPRPVIVRSPSPNFLYSIKFYNSSTYNSPVRYGMMCVCCMHVCCLCMYICMWVYLYSISTLLHSSSTSFLGSLSENCVSFLSWNFSVLYTCTICCSGYEVQFHVTNEIAVESYSYLIIQEDHYRPYGPVGTIKDAQESMTPFSFSIRYHSVGDLPKQLYIDRHLLGGALKMGTTYTIVVTAYYEKQVRMI